MQHVWKTALVLSVIALVGTIIEAANAHFGLRQQIEVAILLLFTLWCLFLVRFANKQVR